MDQLNAIVTSVKVEPQYIAELQVNKTFLFVVGLWSQSADKLTIHSIPCSWIL
jgi:hypothetical protein